MRTISIEKPTGTFFKTCEPQNRTVRVLLHPVNSLLQPAKKVRISETKYLSFYKSLPRVVHGAVLRLTGFEKCPRWFFNGNSAH